MIREVEEKDLRQIYEIYSYYVNHSTAIFDLVPLSFERFCDSLKPVLGRYPFYVAEREEKILGYAYAHAAFSKEAYRFCAELTIYFLPGDHHGMAKGLYDAIERALYEQGCRWLISCITDSNAESIAFHEKLGFAYGGNLPSCGLKFGAWHGVYWYRKMLNTNAGEWIDFCDLHEKRPA
ncbi:GNAT family N-acetyltransferase [uncultured Dubosiella sp.]|jgi:L-amino acid N-acyltransferase YncA|uniref:GNAT family N-acetyltransferase n=2 Tax=uncultured Dubosiella sp. TaxID=1937011 RepID=UPI0025D153BA|nr:GNAT family N-acetyltransferase [uncultured Dubosiella sp.]